MYGKVSKEEVSISCNEADKVYIFEYVLEFYSENPVRKSITVQIRTVSWQNCQSDARMKSNEISAWATLNPHHLHMVLSCY